MSARTISISISDEQLPYVEAAAADEGLTIEEFVPRFLGAYLSDYLELKAALDQADRDIAEGRTIPHEDVVAAFEARFAAVKDSEAA